MWRSENVWNAISVSAVFGGKMAPIFIQAKKKLDKTHIQEIIESGRELCKSSIKMFSYKKVASSRLTPHIQSKPCYSGCFVSITDSRIRFRRWFHLNRRDPSAPLFFFFFLENSTDSCPDPWITVRASTYFSYFSENSLIFIQPPPPKKRDKDLPHCLELTHSAVTVKFFLFYNCF